MSTSELWVKWSRWDIQSCGLLLSLDNKDTINTMFQRESLMLFNMITWLTDYGESAWMSTFKECRVLMQLSNRLYVTISLSLWRACLCTKESSLSLYWRHHAMGLYLNLQVCSRWADIECEQARKISDSICILLNNIISVLK